MASSDFMTGLWRGFRRRCPACGKGHLFAGYLKVQPLCDHCGHDNGQYRADDAPPYFTILLVGHLIIAPLLCFSFIWTWPIAWVLAITMPTVAILTLALLPLVKGAVVGAHWSLHRVKRLEPASEQADLSEAGLGG